MVRRLQAAALLGALLGAAAAESSVGRAWNPKVVELLTDLKKKIEADGKSEQKVYDKFACWCEKTTARKGAAIEDAKTSIEDLTKKALQLTGKTANFRADVAQLESDIAANLDSQRQATAIRDKETASYEGARENLEAAIGALEHAIKTLEGAGEFTQKTASALQQGELVSAAAALGGVLPAASIAYASETDRELVTDFIKEPSLYGPKAKFSSLQQHGNFGDYAPGSTKIQGILKGLYDASMADLESKNAEQARKQKEYEELMATKKESLETMQTTLTSKKETLGEDTQTLANAKLESDETANQLREDEQFFIEARDNCRTKADEWAERTRLRTEESAGVQKALEILTGGADTIASAQSMMLQMRQKRAMRQGGDDQRQKALGALRRLVREQHSIRLASIASMIQTSSKAEFPLVMEAIDKMLAELRQEEMDDITLRDYCQAEEVKVEGEIEDDDHKIERLNGLLERLKAKKAELQSDQKQTESDVAATQDAMAQALAERNEESETFRAALKDDVEAVELLGKAIEALGGGRPSLLQKQKGHSGALRIRRVHGPEYDDTGAPPETFKEPYGGPRDMSAGIEQIMGYIKEDLENEIILAKEEEEKAQKGFEAQRDTSTRVLLALQAKLSTLQAQEAETDDRINKADEKKKTTKSMRQSKKDYRESLKPKCDWMKEAFETRRDKRQEEMNGLMQAKAAVAGGGGAFLQRARQ